MGAWERAAARIVRSNNRRIERVDRGSPNPRPVDGLEWHRRLSAAHSAIRGEWDRFADGGGSLPVIEAIIGEHQGNEGWWGAGLLVANGRVLPAMRDRFPVTTAALSGIPGLRSALWSELGAGARIPTHAGPNAGVLRYHLGIRCGDDTALRVGEVVVPYRDGEGVLFDDTTPHEAWNRDSTPRVTLFCELYRPLPGLTGLANLLVQRVISLDARYREAPERAAEWDRVLNPD